MKGYVVSNHFNLISDLKTLPRYKEVFIALIWRNLRLQYDNLLLGFFWGIFSPLIMATIFFIALDKRVGVDFSHYFLFVYSGFIFWNVFTYSLGQSNSSFIQNRDLLKRAYFPRLLLPLSYIASKLIDFMIALTILTVFLMFSELEIQWIQYTCFTVLALMSMLLVSAGFCLVFSVLSVRFRGLQVIYPFIVQVIFFTSSVVYDSSLTIEEPWLKTLFRCNPITGVLTIFRTGIFNEVVDWTHLIGYLLYAVFIFIVGFVWFKIEDRIIIDYL